ncbi:hypothetical protein CPter91_1117 [Collimonas pratensis]|uniref:Uncharacterized protein n=1 Tax=Collimonas pratensis TaxID=279113 RepID=A0A127Q1I6_9BURK|nr:hypothetical protein CPter91_1117 [Collimonas pratensis]
MRLSPCLLRFSLQPSGAGTERPAHRLEEAAFDRLIDDAAK